MVSRSFAVPINFAVVLFAFLSKKEKNKETLNRLKALRGDATS